MVYSLKASFRLSPIKRGRLPVRGKKVFLHIKRRRWLNKQSKQVVQRDWNLVAQGTRMTVEFAAFLKALSQY
ncbi:ISAon1 family transposase N-terminal region protein [Salegentibacter flavus]